jgi:hypothetical protein
MKRFKVEASRLLNDNNDEDITIRRSIETDEKQYGLGFKSIIQIIVIVATIVSAFFTAQVIARDYTDEKVEKLQTSQDSKIDKIIFQNDQIKTAVTRLETAFTLHTEKN